MGEHGGKPKFITVPPDRGGFFRTHKLPHPWRGQGYPSYHGGGIRQAQHIRTSRYTMLSDFLYNTEAVVGGYKNCPTLTEPWVKKFRRVGKVYDTLLDKLGINRLSIVRAYESPVWNKSGRYLWDKEFEIDFISPTYTDPNDVADAAAGVEGVIAVGVANEERRITVRGIFA
jgi:hypothetical protein